MFGPLRSCCPGKALLVLLGVGVLTLAGGWKLWSVEWSGSPEAPVVQAAEPAQPAPTVRPSSVQTPPANPATKPIAAEPAPKTATVEPVDKTKKATGKDHDRPDALLAVVMQKLHSDAYQAFISTPGMGISRLKPTITVVKRDWQTPQWTSEELSKTQPVVKGAKDFELLHRLSLRNFAGSNTMTEKERWEQGLKNAPEKNERLWEIKSLDLVGLLMHENPTVYISEKLPDMKNLKGTPTRDLDLFESEGLEELIGGKDLYIRSKAETIRVLGPLKAGKACLKCHNDAKEGDMLGAFSYTLRPGQYLVNGQPIPAFVPGPPMKQPLPPKR